MSGGGWEEREDAECQDRGFLGHVSPEAPGNPKLQPGDGPSQLRGWHLRVQEEQRDEAASGAWGLSWTRLPAGGPGTLPRAPLSRSWPALVLQCGLKQVAHLWSWLLSVVCLGDCSH